LKKEIPTEQAIKLFVDGKTDLMPGFLSKKGRKFSAHLTIDREKGKLGFEFAPRKNAKKKDGDEKEDGETKVKTVKKSTKKKTTTKKPKKKTKKKPAKKKTKKKPAKKSKKKKSDEASKEKSDTAET